MAILEWLRDCMPSRMVPERRPGDQLSRRLTAFAADIVLISSRLPKTIQGQHIARQIMRSGTAVAANYGEARGAESRTDFVHKLRVVLKELNETSPFGSS